jgi:hypothetical protein
MVRLSKNKQLKGTYLTINLTGNQIVNYYYISGKVFQIIGRKLGHVLYNKLKNTIFKIGLG